MIAIIAWACAAEFPGPESFFGEALRRQRLAAGLSQLQLGQIVGIRKATISRYETGHCEPRPVVRYALRMALGLDENADGGWWRVDY